MGKKKKEIASLTQVNLPSSIKDMTLEELVNNDDVYIEKKGNKLTARLTTEDSVLNFGITSYSSGTVYTHSKFEKPLEKKDYKDTIKEMTKEGKTQKEIAMNLGMSQSYVSVLLNSGLDDDYIIDEEYDEGNKDCEDCDDYEDYEDSGE